MILNWDVVQKRNIEKKLKKAIKCTIPNFSEDIMEKNVILTEQELKIICNIAITYMEEKQYDHSIKILKTINEQIQNIAQKKDTLCRMMYN